MLSKINNLKNWQAAIIITVIGFAVFFTGLNNPFQGDDSPQIVDNPVVHSISHLYLFFEGGTFYVGRGIAPLYGVYYRPLMTTIFSVIYSVFGPHSFYFHAVQLAICIGSSIFLYLFLRYSFKVCLSLCLALVFLVHPLDSQVVYAIPSMQDALFFFFGILGLWVLVRFSSIKSLFLVVFCLILSLLSKETGILFCVLSCFYLFWWDKKRFYAFLSIFAAPLVLYLVLRYQAIGIFRQPHIAPIDNLSFIGRIYTAPSIFTFFLSKLIFPWKLASSYYWVYNTFSIKHVLVPFVVDLLFIALVVFMAVQIRKKNDRAQYYTYLFFMIWCGIGLLSTLQIVALDMTVCETWFYFSMAGFLGMLGVVIRNYWDFQMTPLIFVVIVLVLGGFGLRTAFRGLDWRNQYVLASRNLSASPENYNAYNLLASEYLSENKLEQAKNYADRSISIYPTYLNYLNLGLILSKEGNYQGALDAYYKGRSFGASIDIINNIAEIGVAYASYSTEYKYLDDSISQYPNDSTLWFYFALLEAKNEYLAAAKVAITNASNDGHVPPNIYYDIMNEVPFQVTLSGLKNTTINISF